MDNVNDFFNTSIISQSYAEGVKRVVGNFSNNQEKFELSKEFIESRERTWAHLFEKFSEVSDDEELYLKTLRPSEESSSPYSSEYRIPVRKSEAQLRYWIQTGNPPCHLNKEEEKEEEEEEAETDKTISISESEVSELRSTSSTSMMVDKKLETSINELLDTGSSGSSVDTATYIRNNLKKGTASVEKDPRVTNFANRENNRVSRSTNVRTSKILLNKSTESSRNTRVAENDSVLQKSMSAALLAESNNGEEIRTDDNEIIERLKFTNIKESEVTFDSKESGIGSLPIGNTEMDKKTRECTSSDSLNEIVPVRKKNVQRMRKLYTGDNSFFDLTSSVVRPVSKNRSLRYSLHPALTGNSIEGIKKRKFRPSLLTLPGSSKAKRKSIGLAVKINRAKDKRRRQSVKDSSISVRKDVVPIEEESAEIVEKGENVCIDPEKEADFLKDKSRANSPIICRKIIKTPKSQSCVNSSSSLSSGDVSKIINEKSREVSGTSFNRSVKNKPRKDSVNAKNQTPKKKINKNNFTALKLTDSRGSVFTTPDESAYSETLETRMKNMMHAKKNLYATDLRSSESAESPPAIRPRQTSVNNSIKKPETPRRSLKRSRNAASDISAKILACGQSNPVIILHDIRRLKNFSDKSDRKIYEKWIRKESFNDAGKKFNKLFDRKICVTKKLKLDNKSAHFRSGEKIESRKAIFRNSFSSEDSLTYLKYDDRKEMKFTEGENVTVTFRTANPDTNDSIFVLSSSEEDNIFEKLSSWSRSGSKKKRIKEKANNVEENINFRPTYKIVSSSSENEENSLNKNAQPTKSRKFRRKFPKRNEGKDSPDSGATICSTEDGCSDKSELPKNSDEKLEKQSQNVNKRLETSKSKQILNGRWDSQAAQSAVNNGPRNCREPRVELQSKRKKALILNATSTDPLKNYEKENLAQKIAKNSKIPVRKISSKRGKKISTKTADNYLKKVNLTDNRRVVVTTKKLTESPSKERKKTTQCKIIADSKDETEVIPSPNYKDRSKTVKKKFGINPLIGGGDGENILHDDESYIFDDEINFLHRDNAGSYLRSGDEKNSDKSLNISSYEKSRSLSERDITLIRDLDNDSKKKSLNNEKKSTIIFQTKEYSESDSDNS